jgi:hypothetical protein
MANTRPITELDFDEIKTNLINYIKANPTFTDYNFEGSALNAIMDILAYNTHTNAYYANMVHNEGFLDTAQKRSSVVSRSKELGYTPRSAVCSTAFVNILAEVPGNTPVFPIPRGTVFRSSNDSGTYNFLVAEDVYCQVIGGQYVFNQVKLMSGILVRNFFKVDTTSNIRSVFSIPNKTVDTSTIKVFVRDSFSAIERVEYFLAENVYELKSDSRKFFLQESYDGFFQIYFGGDVLGKQPVNGNVIDVDYIMVDNYELPDICSSFTLNGVVGLATSLTATTTQIAFGGSDKESTTSIKYNATKSNSAKERAVTVDDYALSLKEKFNFIKSVAVWGGEDNVPPVYGKVFLSIQPVVGYMVTDSIKHDVLIPSLRKSSMITIAPELIDPSYVALDFVTRVRFNPQKTLLTVAAMEANVKTVVRNYVNSISEFNTDYFESHLANKVLGIDSGIMSVDIDKRVGFKLTPTIGVNISHKKSVNNPVLPASISSTKFNVYANGIVDTVSVKEISGSTKTKLNSNGVLETIQFLGLYNGNNILIQEIGEVNMNTGYFDIAFSVYSHITDSRFINIRMELVNDDVIVLRNQILVIENVVTDVGANIVDSNIVVTEIYGK